jgi:hypothetical protein
MRYTQPFSRNTKLFYYRNWKMADTTLYTASQIADMLSEPPQRVTYIIRKYRLKAVMRIGIIRLFSEDQVETMKQGLYGIQIRRSK